jgi:uncharacterized DUF497 family protein
VWFEWDARKERANVRAHGVDFEEARSAFGDPLGRVRADPDHSRGEERFLLLSRSTRMRFLVTVFTERPGRIRIISSRRATPREVRDYEKGV